MVLGKNGKVEEKKENAIVDIHSIIKEINQNSNFCIFFKDCNTFNKMWNTYYLKNQKEHGVCTAFAVINCYYSLLFEKKIEIEKISKQKVESLLKIAKTNGNIKNLSKELNMKIKKRYSSFWSFWQDHKKKQKPTPFLLSIWHKAYGHHLVSVVDYEPITESWRIPNFESTTNLEGWIYDEDLKHYVRNVNDAMITKLTLIL